MNNNGVKDLRIMNTKAFKNASIYVGTYGKYNAGSIAGAWINLADYEDIDEFWEACKELHKDEVSPEFMFQDWEYIPEELISECSLNPAFFEIRNELDKDEEEAFTEFLDHYSYNLRDTEAHKIVSEFREAYCGAYETEREYAEQLFDECYLHEIPEGLRSYVDYDAFARDLFMCDYTHTGSYVFRR